MKKRAKEKEWKSTMTEKKAAGCLSEEDVQQLADLERSYLQQKDKVRAVLDEYSRKKRNIEFTDYHTAVRKPKIMDLPLIKLQNTPLPYYYEGQRGATF